jgi:hypothetical protein
MPYKTLLIDEKDYEWDDSQESIVKKWADKALCFKIMHEHTSQSFLRLNNLFHIPIIIISTLTGASNLSIFGFEDYKNIATCIIGSFNIISAILVSISSFIGSPQKVESHRIASISWDKFARKIQIEVAKQRPDRIDAKKFIHFLTNEYDHIIDISPVIPDTTIEWFKKIIDPTPNQINCINFKRSNILKTDTKKFENIWNEIELPEIIGKIKPIQIVKSNLQQTNIIENKIVIDCYLKNIP